MVIATDSAAPSATITVPAAKKPEKASTTLVPEPAGPNKLFAREGVTYGDFRDDLLRDGFVVVKGAIPRERADNAGGLIVCRGAHLLSEEFHEPDRDEPDRVWAWTKEWYGFADAGMRWLEEEGCEWVKVDAEPGDLLLWDSRTPHYNLSPEGSRPRFCVYACYMPAAEATQEDLVRKRAAFENLQSTTHWPNAMHVGGIPVKRGGEPCPYNSGKPRREPELSAVGFRLTGIPYIQGAPIEV
ncbi:phytanoyl dioxygenase [Colletotrichum plurivorum]|uniref:Phytanoyl dioxygenase n=1 Tax=Colletotrichum plurivorum TaxID=2175906 RepID=A0A8H6NR09_9PEZI|nr:phytanoyl dioxygenase [Colletotrichum plurivorum]